MEGTVSLPGAWSCPRRAVFAGEAVGIHDPALQLRVRGQRPALLLTSLRPLALPAASWSEALSAHVASWLAVDPLLPLAHLGLSLSSFLHGLA